MPSHRPLKAAALVNESLYRWNTPSTSDLNEKLRKKLEKLVKEVEPDLLPDNTKEAEWVNPQEQEPLAVEFEGTVIDVEEEVYGASK